MSNQQGATRIQGIIVPLLSVILGLLIGAIVMWSFGYDAIAGYSAMLKGRIRIAVLHRRITA